MIYLTGFLMAIADSVPGVSGGTIAFILGEYENFISSISGLLTSDSRVSSIKYLIRFMSAWVIGFLSSVLIISQVMEENIYEISSLFLGLVLFAIVLIYKQENEYFNSLKNIIYTIIGLVLVVFVTQIGLTLDVSSTGLSEPSILIYIYIFISGFVAISAMLLPGMSGSTVLLIFGLYYVIIDAIKTFITLDFSVLPILMCFGFGILFGLMFATKVISGLLKNYYSQMLYLIIGLMLGSLYSIITGPASLSEANDYLSTSSFSIVFFLIGGLLIFGLSKLNDRHS